MFLGVQFYCMLVVQSAAEHIVDRNRYPELLAAADGGAELQVRAGPDADFPAAGAGPGGAGADARRDHAPAAGDAVRPGADGARRAAEPPGAVAAGNGQTGPGVLAVPARGAALGSDVAVVHGAEPTVRAGPSQRGFLAGLPRASASPRAGEHAKRRAQPDARTAAS